MIYPNQQQTVVIELIGATQEFVVNNTTPKWITSFAMQQSKDASTTLLVCGTTTVGRNYGKDLPMIQTYYRCDDVIFISKSGQDNSTVYVNYTYTDPLSIYGTTPNSATSPASITFIDMASTSAVASGLHDTIFMFAILAFIIVSYIGWRFGTWLYRR